MSITTVPAEPVLYDRRGRVRTKATRPGHRAGMPPVTKGRTYPPDPYQVADIVALLSGCVPTNPRHVEAQGAEMLRALIVLLWRTGLRISEALALEERDLDQSKRAIVVRRGKGGKRRVVVMDEFGWKSIDRWRTVRTELPDPYGPIFCVLMGPTAGRACSSSDIRRRLKRAAEKGGVRRRVNPHAFRHTMAVELWREDVKEYVIQIQLGHARLDVTALYLRGLGNDELMKPVADRRAPVMPLTA